MPITALILGALVSFVVYVAYILIISFTVWMMIDAAKQDRFWWLVLVIGIPIIGPVAYFITEKKHEYAKIPAHHVHKSETERQHENTHHKHEENKESIILAEGEAK